MSLEISFLSYVQYIEPILAALGPVVMLQSMLIDQAMSAPRLQLTRVERSAARRRAVSP